MTSQTAGASVTALADHHLTRAGPAPAGPDREATP
jgi:hypothetical protein